MWNVANEQRRAWCDENGASVSCWPAETFHHIHTFFRLSSPFAVLAMVRRLKQALSWIGCLQALEAGPTVEEPCPAEFASYDHEYHDQETGASLPSQLCEEAMQSVIKYMREIDAYTPCMQETLKEQGLTPIGTRWIFTNKVDTEHPPIRARLLAQETKKTIRMDLTDTSMTFAQPHGSREFVFSSQEP